MRISIRTGASHFMAEPYPRLLAKVLLAVLFDVTLTPIVEPD